MEGGVEVRDGFDVWRLAETAVGDAVQVHVCTEAILEELWDQVRVFCSGDAHWGDAEKEEVVQLTGVEGDDALFIGGG